MTLFASVRVVSGFSRSQSSPVVSELGEAYYYLLLYRHKQLGTLQVGL